MVWEPEVNGYIPDSDAPDLEGGATWNLNIVFDDYELNASTKIPESITLESISSQISWNCDGNPVNVDENFGMHSDKLRNWHYMWSFFYYNKKNYGYLYSLIKSLSRLLRSVLRIIFYSITFNNKQRIIYTYRFLGLINSIFLKKSKYRVNIDD